MRTVKFVASPSFKLAASQALCVVVALVCLLTEYGTGHFARAMEQQARHYDAANSDVDLATVTAVTQALLFVECFVVGRALRHKLSKRPFSFGSGGRAVSKQPAAPSRSNADKSKAEMEELAALLPKDAPVTHSAGGNSYEDWSGLEEDVQEVLRSSNVLLAVIPRLAPFQRLFSCAIATAFAGFTFALVKLLLIFNADPSPSRWALVLTLFALFSFQLPLCITYVRYIDKETVVAQKALTASTASATASDVSHPNNAPPHDTASSKSPTLAASSTTTVSFRGSATTPSSSSSSTTAISVSEGPLSLSQRRARRRWHQRVEEARKKAKDKRERAVDADKAAANMGRILSLSRPDAWLLFFGFISLGLSAFASALVPLFTGRVVDKVALSNPQRHTAEFHAAIVYLIGAGTAAGVFAGSRGGILLVALARLKVRVRDQLFASITRQEMGFFDETLTGDITSRLVADTTQLGDQIALNINIFLRSLIQCIGTLVFMFVTSWKLSVLTFILLPLLVFVSQAYGKYVQQLSTATQTSVANSTKVAEEVVSSMATVRSFANEEQECQRYRDELEEFYRLNVRQSYAYGSYVTVTSILPILVTAAVLYFGGLEVIAGKLSSGALVSFLLYQSSLTDNMNNLTSVFGGLMTAVGAAEKVFLWMDRPPHIQETGGLKPLTLKGSIEFKDVKFAYPSRPSLMVLNGVSFTVHPGQTVALVGPSGGGKSSCVKLIERFYVPLSGDILLDGLPLAEYDKRWRHRVISMVGQEPVLFATTVKDNIAYGMEDDDDFHGGGGDNFSIERIVEAAKLANAHDFIMRLPNGYFTEIGERGVTLSGGQKQRVAIARALLRNPTILLLDEATSALDSESEAVVQDAIDRLMVGRTVVVIAHRLSTVQHADNILVIQDGHVQESGTHAELLARRGIYHQLVQRQLTGYQGASATHYSTNCKDDVITRAAAPLGQIAGTDSSSVTHTPQDGSASND